MNTSISDVGLSPRVYKILSSLGIKNIERLTDWREKDLLRTPDCGRRSLAEIKTMMALNGLTLKEDYDIDERGMNDCSESIKSMTLRQYAAIKLKVPDSGEDWLDDMIRASLRDDFALSAGVDDARYAYHCADKMLEARK